jgi:two-component system NtrC family response regulator
MPAKILLIDDDTSLRRVLEYNLQEAGYEVLAAADGDQGLAIFNEQTPDLVITDLKMPGMSGFELLSAIKSSSPQTLVMVITAFGAVETAVEAMKLGAYDYITKPFNRDELRLVVAKALEMRGLAEENQRLRAELSDRTDFNNIIGISRGMEQLFAMVRKVADSEATVLIGGESGTGKELVARAIHANSARRGGPFIAINCAAIPRDLMESELFGHLRGAFTGAVRDKIGRFQAADGGTLFLDEVGELPLELQPKLLRALQEREIEPVGATESRRIDVRVVAATNSDLESQVANGAFREDLYYRLAIIPLQLPPLRQRSEDIPLLVRHFFAKHGGAGVGVTDEALAMLRRYSWPGNVRELENTVERILIMRNSDTIGEEDLPDKIREQQHSREVRIVNLPEDGYPLELLEKEIVAEALERNNWNQTAAARFLRIPRHTLIYRMEKYQITPKERKS